MGKLPRCIVTQVTRRRRHLYPVRGSRRLHQRTSRAPVLRCHLLQGSSGPSRPSGWSRRSSRRPPLRSLPFPTPPRRVLPLPALAPVQPARFIHRTALLDDHGRVREATLFAHLGWKRVIAPLWGSPMELLLSGTADAHGTLLYLARESLAEDRSPGRARQRRPLLRLRPRAGFAASTGTTCRRSEFPEGRERWPHRRCDGDARRRAPSPGGSDAGTTAALTRVSSSGRFGHRVVRHGGSRLPPSRTPVTRSSRRSSQRRRRPEALGYVPRRPSGTASPRDPRGQASWGASTSGLRGPS